MQIPEWPQAGEREAELLAQVLESRQWGGFHPLVQEFEQSFAAYQHARFGIAMMNGTVTLEAMLEVLGIGPGDEVIIPAISFISTATAINRVGAIPVFVDIGRDTYNLDLERVREAISPQTRAVMAVHFGGAMCNMPALESLCREHGLLLLEDAAHAQGSEWNGQRAGSFARVSSFSFQNGKILTAGEGGLLVTSDEELAVNLRSLANCGRLPERSFYEHHRLGTNFRMTAFQAAVLLAQWERLPQQFARRTANAAVLRRELENLEDIVWQEIPTEQTQNSWYLLIGRVRSGRAEDRNALVAALHSAGVPCTPFYPHTLYRNPVYRECGCRVMRCPEAEARIHDAFWLPHRVLLAEEDTIREIAQVFRDALAVKA